MNAESHLKPIIATHVIDQLFDSPLKPFGNKEDVYKVATKHFTTFLDRIAKDLGIKVDQIIDFELNAYDH